MGSRLHKMALVSVCMSAILAGHEAALAAQSTCSGSAGLDTWSTTGETDYEGISANISVRKGLVCDSVGDSTNYTNARVGMYSGGSNPGQAFSGYTRWANLTTIPAKAWYQRDASDSLHQIIDGTFNNLTQGSTYHFWVQYQNTSSRLRMNINTHVIAETTWDPFLYWTLGWLQVFGGDARYLQSDVPGLSSAKAHYSSMEVQLLNDTWTSSFSAPVSSVSTTRWTHSSISGNAFDMWTSSP
jgi:hypothetical protein